MKVMQRLFLKKIFHQKINILVDDHEVVIIYIPPTSSGQTVKQIGVIQEVISPEVSKLNLSVMS